MISTVLWAIWIASFFAIEGPALFNKQPGDTLSEHLRAWFHTGSKPGRWVWVIASGVGAAWLIVHIATPAGWLG